MNTNSSKTCFLAIRACGPRKLRHGSSSDTAIYLGKTCPQFPTESFTLSSLSKSQLNKCNQACPCIRFVTLDESLGFLCTSFRLSQLSASFRKENDKPANYFRTKSAEHFPSTKFVLVIKSCMAGKIKRSGTSAHPPPPPPPLPRGWSSVYSSWLVVACFVYLCIHH